MEIREVTELWQWFRDESLVDQPYFQNFGVEFDSLNGEAFYNDKMDEGIKILEEKGLWRIVLRALSTFDDVNLLQRHDRNLTGYA